MLEFSILLQIGKCVNKMHQPYSNALTTYSMFWGLDLLRPHMGSLEIGLIEQLVLMYRGLSKYNFRYVKMLPLNICCAVYTNYI